MGSNDVLDARESCNISYGPDPSPSKRSMARALIDRRLRVRLALLSPQPFVHGKTNSGTSPLQPIIVTKPALCISRRSEIRSCCCPGPAIHLLNISRKPVAIVCNDFGVHRPNPHAVPIVGYYHPASRP